MSRNPHPSGSLSPDTSPGYAPPPGAEVSGDAQSWRISVGYNSTEQLLGAGLLLLVAAAVAALFWSDLRGFFAPGTTDPAWNWLPLAVVVVFGVLGLWQLVRGLFGRLTLNVVGQQATLSEGIGPLRRTRTLDWSRVWEVQAVDQTTSRPSSDPQNPNTTELRRTYLQLRGEGVDLICARGLTGERLWWLRDELRRRLVGQHF